jgi:hypothetical protein
MLGRRLQEYSRYSADDMLRSFADGSPTGEMTSDASPRGAALSVTL